VSGEIERLIGLLDDDSTEVAEDAKAELISVGVDVIEPLAAAVPWLERFGQLSAIEVFEHLGDPGAGPVLIDLLSSEHDTVREWSAWAIAQLDVREAVPALQAAYQRLRVGDGRLDDSEAVAMRRVLTVLGSRDEVVPPLTASLRVPAGSLDHTPGRPLGWRNSSTSSPTIGRPCCTSCFGRSPTAAPSGRATSHSTASSIDMRVGWRWWRLRGSPRCWSRPSSRSGRICS
jgi:hypothetical protein